MGLLNLAYALNKIFYEKKMIEKLEMTREWDQIARLVIQESCEFSRGISSCRSTFITGSYAADPALWVESASARKNMNIYFVAKSGYGADLRYALRELLDAIDAALIRSECGLEVDCHPYTLTPASRLTSRTLMLTTKVLESEYEQQRYSLPPNIGEAWRRNFISIFGEKDCLEALRLNASTEEEWMASLYEGLTRYRNMLDHLPLAISPNGDSNQFIVESAKYAEEAAKDCISLFFSIDELVLGNHIAYLKNWEISSAPVFDAALGSAGLDFIKKVTKLKKLAAEKASLSASEKKRFWLDSLDVVNFVFEIYSKRVATGFPEKHWLRRVNVFI